MVNTIPLGIGSLRLTPTPTRPHRRAARDLRCFRRRARAAGGGRRTPPRARREFPPPLWGWVRVGGRIRGCGSQGNLLTPTPARPHGRAARDLRRLRRRARAAGGGRRIRRPPRSVSSITGRPKAGAERKGWFWRIERCSRLAARIHESPPMSLVLVTGGAGFIGSHLVEALLARGYGVRVLDSLVYGRREWVPAAAEFVQADVADLAACRAAAAGVSGIFHLAGMSRVIPTFDTVETGTEANVRGTQNILIAARDAGAKVVYSGSSTYYGNRPPPHREYETPPDLLNMYGLTKQVGEQYCLAFDRHFGVPAVVLRYFNVYGPRQPQTGNYALVMGIFLRRWADGETLVIHGEGKQRRDFVHVRDVARANILAFESERR